MTSRESLLRIRRLYGDVLLDVSAEYSERAGVLAGIMQRESAGGFSPLLTIPGTHGIGDHGHGHGLMQIDDRAHPEFIASGLWKDPVENVRYAASILVSNRKTLLRLALSAMADPAYLERCAIAAYNCGAGNVLKAITASRKAVDARTAHGDYSRAVLELAALYEALEPRAALSVIGPEPEPEPVGPGPDDLDAA